MFKVKCFHSSKSYSAPEQQTHDFETLGEALDFAKKTVKADNKFEIEIFEEHDMSQPLVVKNVHENWQYTEKFYELTNDDTFSLQKLVNVV